MSEGYGPGFSYLKVEAGPREAEEKMRAKVSELVAAGRRKTEHKEREDYRSRLFDLLGQGEFTKQMAIHVLRESGIPIHTYIETASPYFNEGVMPSLGTEKDATGTDDSELTNRLVLHAEAFVNTVLPAIPPPYRSRHGDGEKKIDMDLSRVAKEFVQSLTDDELRSSDIKSMYARFVEEKMAPADYNGGDYAYKNFQQLVYTERKKREIKSERSWDLETLEAVRAFLRSFGPETLAMPDLRNIWRKFWETNPTAAANINIRTFRYLLESVREEDGIESKQKKTPRQVREFLSSLSNDDLMHKRERELYELFLERYGYHEEDYGFEAFAFLLQEQKRKRGVTEEIKKIKDNLTLFLERHRAVLASWRGSKIREMYNTFLAENNLTPEQYKLPAFRERIRRLIEHK